VRGRARGVVVAQREEEFPERSDGPEDEDEHEGLRRERRARTTRRGDPDRDRDWSCVIEVWHCFTHRVLEHAKEHLVGRRVPVRAYSISQLPESQYARIVSVSLGPIAI
jgi:hypothetical protein